MQNAVGWEDWVLVVVVEEEGVGVSNSSTINKKTCHFVINFGANISGMLLLTLVINPET